MAWDFSTDPEWSRHLAWVEDFVLAECEPIDLIVTESGHADLRAADWAQRRALIVRI